MGEFEFGQNKDNVREFFPTSAGIDWYSAYLLRHGEENLSAYAETIDEYGEFCEQIHQENCCFYINRTDPSFDVVTVIDHRDESGDFWFTREQIGAERFDQLLQGIGEEVMVVYTKYPMKRIAEFVMQTLVFDIEKGTIE